MSTKNIAKDLTEQHVHQLMALLQTQQITAKALAQAYLDKIARENPSIHAYVETYATEAMNEAHQADIRIQSGTAGPFCGIPYAVKDMIDVKGKRTGLGSKSSASYTAHDDALVVKRLRAAGMVMLGKVHTVEFAYGAWGTNQHLGAPKNPHKTDQHYITGGSSNGSGAAVAAQLAPWALGTDTGGSIRIPSSFCGLTGLRPTLGLIPTAGIKELAPSLDTVGPLARCVQDAELLYYLLSNQMQPTSADQKVYSLEGIRIAVLADSERASVQAETLKHYEESITQLRRQGAQIDVIELPASLDSFAQLCANMIAYEGYPALQTILENHAEPVDAEVRERFAVAKEMCPTDYEHLLNQQRTLRAKFDFTLKNYDALLTPTTIGSAIPLHAVASTTWIPAALTRFASILSYPALATPNGIDQQGLPTSIQIIGLPNTEAKLFKIAKGLSYEKPNN